MKLQQKRTSIFAIILKGQYPLILLKDKILHQKYKGLSDAVVKSAFGWTDDYWMPNGNII